MANITETDSFDAGVYQLETTDPALGGANGVMNTPPRSLTNRTRFLLNRILDGVLSFVADSGAKNAIVASFPQPIAALVDGMEVSFRVAVLSDSAVTLKLTNAGGATLPTLALWGADHVALVGGELPAGATVSAKLNLTLNASNGGAWVVSSITGGYARILTAPSGDTSNRAANMAAVSNATDGMATVNVGVGADVVLTAAQYGCAILKLTGTPTVAINLVLPNGQTGQWIINNQQGGTNNITVLPSGGAGVILPQGATPTIVVSDGTTASFASAQAAQNAFSILPFTGITGTTLTVPGGYTPGAIIIEKNGGVLEPTDFVATVSPTITLTKAAVSTDVFNVYRFTSFTVANALQKSGDTMAGPLNVQTATTATEAVQFGQIPATVRSMCNLISNVAAASATKIVTADALIVQTALGGLPYCLSSLNLTGNLATQMDTGSAPVSGYVAEYVIYNPNAAISSTNPRLLYQTEGTTAATSVYSGAFMPAGYTASALISAWRTNASSQFSIGFQRDRHINIAPNQVIANATGSLTPVSFSISAAAPKSAVRYWSNSTMNVGAGTSGCSFYVCATAQGVGIGPVAGLNSPTQTASAGSSPTDILTPQTSYYVFGGTSVQTPAGNSLAINGYDI